MPSLLLKILKKEKAKYFGIPAKTTIATISFTNMTGYVGIAEKMPLDLLPEFMNRYFEANCSAIIKHEGCIDQFEGDKIMAFWGLHHPPQESAQLACESAISQIKEMEKFYSWAKEQGHPCPDIRIGISTGPVVMGSIGGKTRMDFTALGKPVIIANALQDKAKTFGSCILVDENTRKFAMNVQFGEVIEMTRGLSNIRAFPIRI